MEFKIFLFYFICSVFSAFKQYKSDRENFGFVIVAVLVGPLWLLGAILRQVFVEDWK